MSWDSPKTASNAKNGNSGICGELGVQSRNQLDARHEQCHTKGRQISPRSAGSGFRAWASIFARKAFVNVIVYADESGTHDETGKKDGSNVAALAGFAASTKEWERFSADWQRVLNSYEADYFHFYEFAEASAVARGKRKPSSGFKDNPYRDWPLKKLDKFLFSLAKIAGSGNKIPIAGTINVKKYNEWLAEQKRLAQPTDDGYPYKYCVSEFFRVFFYEIALQWPTNRDPVTFVFDQKADKDWVSAITQCFANAQKYDATPSGGYDFLCRSAIDGELFERRAGCEHTEIASVAF
jgi:hypothetical protein